jgi:signal transduction histidine kinase
LGLFLFRGVKKYVAFGITVTLFFLIKLFKLQYWHEDSNEDFAFNLVNAFTTFFVVFMIATLYKKFFDTYEATISKKNKDLELLNIEKNKLFSIIAHDLRTPLGNLNQTLSLVASGTLTDAELSMIMKKLSENAVYTAEMLDNLLNWSNTQMKGKKVIIEKFKINTIVVPIINQYQLLAEAKNIVIENHIVDTIEVVADKNMTQLVVRNLLSNAIKFSHRDGCILLNAVNEKNSVVVNITDTGIGISKHDMDGIFTNITFTRAGTAGEKGTGLGLPMCKEFVMLNNGTIWLDSRQGEGTTVYFSLPC